MCKIMDEIREDGREEGRIEERTRINMLIEKLLQLGRTQDLLRTTTDSVYQEQLLEEFGI